MVKLSARYHLHLIRLFQSSKFGRREALEDFWSIWLWHQREFILTLKNGYWLWHQSEFIVTLKKKTNLS